MHGCMDESFNVRLGKIFVHAANVPDNERSFSTDVIDVTS